MTGKKDNSELLAEVEALRKEVALLHEANAKPNTNAIKTLKSLYLYLYLNMM